MLNLSEEAINAALLRIEVPLQKYCWLQDNVDRCDVSKDREFQRRYNHFYRVMRKSPQWYTHYYALLEQSKRNPISFADALRLLKQHTVKYEASFASKLVATLNTDRPVIDKFVLKNFNMRLPYPSCNDREAKIIEVYAQLCRLYESLMTTDTAVLIFSMFTALYPWASISKLKQIDLVLWQNRD